MVETKESKKKRRRNLQSGVHGDFLCHRNSRAVGWMEVFKARLLWGWQNWAVGCREVASEQLWFPLACVPVGVLRSQSARRDA